MPVPAAALSNVAVAPGPATNVTPTGRPEIAVLLKPESVATVVPSAVLVALGKTSMYSVSVEPRDKVKFGR